ncbi:MAG: hypothetical protein HUU06_03660 [Planctomycetaceae bacterium]|nr:VRR-NUC domain-containing protein [Planctomycetota bacterium]MCK6530886.1 VRR-NUC domain-containing protein [Myxococcota bacterium]NUN51873.1 hypothetical protein [Planctomycetaceae bacterium]
MRSRRHDETRLLRAILRTFGARPGLRLFRNSVGMVRLPGGGAIPYGLCPGSADLVGWRTLPSGVAQFVALEVKTSSGHLAPAQRAFLLAVVQAGGLAAVVRSLDDVERLLR